VRNWESRRCVSRVRKREVTYRYTDYSIQCK